MRGIEGAARAGAHQHLTPRYEALRDRPLLHGLLGGYMLCATSMCKKYAYQKSWYRWHVDDVFERAYVWNLHVSVNSN